jgi:hemerythrin-like domain-containing protein
MFCAVSRLQRKMAGYREDMATTQTTSSVTHFDPARILKADHREVEQLLAKLGKSEEGPQRSAMLDELESKLTLHMQLEESLVYPLIASLVGSEDEEEAEVEHGLARDGLAKMRSLVEAPGFGAAVEMLTGGIKHHVEEEENELLPELKTAMERADWVQLGDKLADAKQAAGAPVSAPARRKSSKRSTKTTKR